MPTYCFKTDDGEVVEREFLTGRAPRQITCDDGRTATRSVAEELRQMYVPSRKGWPLTCVASGVHAAQAGELRDHLARRGVPTEVTPDGDPVYRNAGHRRRALRARGIIDKASFC